MAIETVPAQRVEWVNLVLRMDIPPQRKAVAFALTKFANPDGTKVFPGQGKVADMAGLHETNARKHIKALLAAGMLMMVKRGGGRGGATNTYRLSRPADITTLPLWLDPDMNRLDDGNADAEEYQAPALGEGASESQEQGAPALGESVDNSTAVPVDNPETPSAGALHSDPVDEETPSVSAINTERSAQKYRALALPDHTKTKPRPNQPPAGLRNASTSLALVPPVHNDDGMAGVSQGAPTDPELEAAQKTLIALRPAASGAYQIAARTELEVAGVPLTRRAVITRAAELATESAMNGARTA